MKGSVRILTLVILLLLLSSTLASPQQYQLPVNKTVNPGCTSVKFEGRTYRFITQGYYRVTLSSINGRYVGLHVRPINGEVQPFRDISVQWDPFTPVGLSIDSSGGNDYELDTENGYAEKVG